MEHRVFPDYGHLIIGGWLTQYLNLLFTYLVCMCVDAVAHMQKLRAACEECSLLLPCGFKLTPSFPNPSSWPYLNFCFTFMH